MLCFLSTFCVCVCVVSIPLCVYIYIYIYIYIYWYCRPIPNRHQLYVFHNSEIYFWHSWPLTILYDFKTLLILSHLSKKNILIGKCAECDLISFIFQQIYMVIYRKNLLASCYWLCEMTVIMNTGPEAWEHLRGSGSFWNFLKFSLAERLTRKIKFMKYSW